ncbi:HTH domain-containing protein [Clostridium estertheticum]|uniref:helix-turn-helix domain-containing protein n=1 Tax=Clostridium estertheticum TaxID=238834 RepID=UPI001CF4B522|nr:HTH domain-containing protein [Clostridium estertheticum]MCB2307311.1 HTH domain-containing protein [Clostridium estertheticum]MCB2344961.1 HTH domain-containing protein [Clostridium estertheticum]MCB2349877.1 HTH domain-containing protein [Clostridium estertheticum]WAG48200.1 HTH domain-containing protein [Clostridium estertheticum]
MLKAMELSWVRPTRSLHKEFNKHYSKWENKEVTGVEFAKLFNISRATLYRHIKKYEM